MQSAKPAVQYSFSQRWTAEIETKVILNIF